MPSSVIHLAYHFYFSAFGAQLLVSDQHGVTLAPPGLERTGTERVGKWRGIWGSTEMGKGERDHGHSIPKTEVDTLVSALPRLDVDSRPDCSW